MTAAPDGDRAAPLIPPSPGRGMGSLSQVLSVLSLCLGSNSQHDETLFSLFVSRFCQFCLSCLFQSLLLHRVMLGDSMPSKHVRIILC